MHSMARGARSRATGPGEGEAGGRGKAPFKG